MYIQGQNVGKTHVHGAGTAMEEPVKNHANFKIWTKRRATVLYISITLSYAVDQEENMTFMLEGCMGQRYSTKHEARPTICINKVVFCE